MAPNRRIIGPGLLVAALTVQTVGSGTASADAARRSARSARAEPAAATSETGTPPRSP